MLKIDLSSTVPRQMWVYLLGVIPGLIFESSLGLADPSMAHSMIDRAKQVYPFGPYALLVLFAVSCLISGQVFFLLSWFLDSFMGMSFRLARGFVPTVFGSNWLYRAFGRLQGNSPNRNLFIRLLSKTIFWGRRKKYLFEIRPIWKCWHLSARILLKRRFGIKRPRHSANFDESEWQVWWTVLGKPGIFREAYLSMRTVLACTLAELAALRISPILRNEYVVTATIVVAATGLVQSFELARWRYEPARNSIVRLIEVLKDLSDTTLADSKSPEAEKSLSLNIDTGEKKSDEST